MDYRQDLNRLYKRAKAARTIKKDLDRFLEAFEQNQKAYNQKTFIARNTIWICFN